jgi:hypothetical protein
MVSVTRIPECRKGRQPVVEGPPRSFVAGMEADPDNSIWVLCIRARIGPGRRTADTLLPAWVGRIPPPASCLTPLLPRVAHSRASIFGRHGPLSPMALACRRLRLDSNPVVPSRTIGARIDRDIGAIRGEGFRLRHWMQRFRGIATVNLSSYLAWYAMVRLHVRLPDCLSGAFASSPRRRTPIPQGCRWLLFLLRPLT